MGAGVEVVGGGGGAVGAAVAVAVVPKVSCVFGPERVVKELQLLEQARFTGASRALRMLE